MDLKDMKIIVTGAASGLGRCFTEELAKAGASVMAADMNVEGLAELKESIEGNVETCVVDVSSEEQVVAMVEATVEAFGEVNGLVNNAGIFRDALLVKKDRETGALRKMTLGEWQKVIDVDLTGPFLCTREVAAKMIEQDTPGVIIGISSVSRHGNRGQSNYSAAKAGLVADTKLWGEELARYGIRTGAVAPGFTRTPILEGMPPRMLEKIEKGIPLGRTGEPFEIWQAVKFIIECDYFTGRCVDVDGGVKV
jgi:3-oxoacyl-[acyl-carrier protein] reductase